MAPGGLSPLADHDPAGLGQAADRADRLPGDQLLRRAEEEFKSLDEVDPKLLAIYDRLGVPLHERAQLAGVAVDAVFDSVSVGTTFKKELKEAGVIFCSFTEAVHEHPELIRKYLGIGGSAGRQLLRRAELSGVHRRLVRVHPQGRALPDGAVDLFPHQCRRDRPVRAHADHGRGGRLRVSYLEGCTAPMRDENQLHAAVVELVALDDASIKYSTVQNWYPGDENGVGGIYNFVTKRGECRGARTQDLLDPGRDRLGDHLEVPVVRAAWRRFGGRVLVGGADPPPAAGRHRHQDDPHRQQHQVEDHRQGHLGRGGQNTYRGLVKVERGADGARNYTQCDSLLIGKRCGAHTFPYIEVKNPSAVVEHEATTSKISDDQLFYCPRVASARRTRCR